MTVLLLNVARPSFLLSQGQGDLRHLLPPVPLEINKHPTGNCEQYL